MSLTLVGLWLAAVGAGDLGRPAHDVPVGRRRVVCLAVGLVVLLGGLGLVVSSVGPFLVLAPLLGALLVGWLLASGRALDPGVPERRRGRWRTAALAALGTGLLVAVLGAQVVDVPASVPSWLDETVLARRPPSDLVVILGVLLAQLVTANIAVRLLLDAVGVPATTNEKQLKGGRVLGPMERVFLVALGAAGELTAAAVVVAAKGLLRFPELQRAQQRGPSGQPDGPSDVTEYFLIGSFASWLLALAGAALIRLT